MFWKKTPGIITRNPLQNPEGEADISLLAALSNDAGINHSWAAMNATCHPFPYPVDVVEIGSGGGDQIPYYPAGSAWDYSSREPQLVPATRSLHQILSLR